MKQDLIRGSWFQRKTTKYLRPACLKLPLSANFLSPVTNHYLPASPGTGDVQQDGFGAESREGGLQSGGAVGLRVLQPLLGGPS